jgi:putative transposase
MRRWSVLLSQRVKRLSGVSHPFHMVVVMSNCGLGGYRTFRYRLHPTVRQSGALARQLDLQRELYNAALEERIGAWNWERRKVTYFDQLKTLTGLKDVRPEVVACGITLCRGTLKRLDWAFDGFFRRVKRGEAPGFPGFRSARRWDSLQWEDMSGWKVNDARKLRLLGIGEIKMNYFRPLEGIPKAITVKREGTKWWVNVRCANVPRKPLLPTGREIGIDLGVVNVVATSEGDLIKSQRFGSQAREKLADAQRRLATKQRGSNRRRREVEAVARRHRKVANQRRNAAHQLSRRLVNEFDLIALEDLSIACMTRAPKPRSDPSKPFEYLPNGSARKAGLNRSINDAGWGQLVSMIHYKAECAGRTVMSVSPRHTSQRCAECGHREASNRVSQAVFRCQHCGHEDHADVNAARNILWAGRAQRA